MYAKTKIVSCALSDDIVRKIDRKVNKIGTPRSEFLRIAILKHAEALGLIKLDLDDEGGIYSLDAREAVA